MTQIKRNAVMFTIGAILGFGAVHLVSQVSADAGNIFDAHCADCHYMSDFEGVEASYITDKILSIVEGAEGHPSVDITADDAALMIEYLTK